MADPVTWCITVSACFGTFAESPGCSFNLADFHMFLLSSPGASFTKKSTADALLVNGFDRSKICIRKCNRSIINQKREDGIAILPLEQTAFFPVKPVNVFRFSSSGICRW